MKKKGKTERVYKLVSTGNWIVSPKAQKVLDRIERKKNFRRKVQKKK